MRATQPSSRRDGVCVRHGPRARHGKLFVGTSANASDECRCHLRDHRQLVVRSRHRGGDRWCVLAQASDEKRAERSLRTGLRPRTSILFSRTSFLLSQTSFRTGQTAFLLAQTSILFSRTSFLLSQTSFRTEQTAFLLARTSILFARTSFLLDQTSFRKGKNDLS